MTKTANQQGIIAQAQAAPKKKSLNDLVKNMMPAIEKALPKVITPDRFARIAMTALSSNEALAKCDQISFLGALMQAAQLGLEPNTPTQQAFLIPYGGKCQFQIGYKGLIELARRGGEVKEIYAEIIYSNDEYEVQLGLDRDLKHKPKLGDRGEPVYYYGVFKLVNGGYGFEVMSVDDIKRHRDRFSQAAKSGFSPWKDNFDEMAKKTVLKRVLKYAPMRTEFLQAMSIDEKVASVPDENDLTTVEMVYEEISSAEQNNEALIVEQDNMSEKTFLEQHKEMTKNL